MREGRFDMIGLGNGLRRSGDNPSADADKASRNRSLRAGATLKKTTPHEGHVEAQALCQSLWIRMRAEKCFAAFTSRPCRQSRAVFSTTSFGMIFRGRPVDIASTC